jgi:nucleotide-binding universal stress UspA family protein
MRIVLLAFDGSKHAMQAARFALDLAKDSNDKYTFIIACAVPPPGAWQILPYNTQEELEEQFERIGHTIVEPVVALMTEAGAAHAVYLGKDSPAACIARLVREQRCDMVVMGAHDPEHVHDLLMGSVVSRVLRLVDVPVVVVK